MVSPAAHQDVVLGLGAQEQAGNVDALAEGLAVAGSAQDEDVVAGGRNAAGRGQHVAHADVVGLQREAAGLLDLAEHRHLVAAHLQQHDVDLRLLEDVGLLQRVGDAVFGLADAQAAER